MKCIHFESIDSTNTYLKNNYESLDNLTFVSADRQTQGRGRNTRIWYSQGNNLYFSILLKDLRFFNLTNSLSIISAYTIIQVLKQYGINDLSIKWPNDVYVNNNKICGILLEAISKEDIECLIIGVGINVNQVEFEGDYINEPISMINILNRKIDIDELKNVVYRKFEDNFNRLLDNYDFYEDIKELDCLKNKEVYALINNVSKKVLVKGINNDYTLKVISEGKEISLNSGEISFHI